MLVYYHAHAILTMNAIYLIATLVNNVVHKLQHQDLVKIIHVALFCISNPPDNVYKIFQVKMSVSSHIMSLF